MEELVFDLTNNAWINNGFCRLANFIENNFGDKIIVNIFSSSIVFKAEEDISKYIISSMKYFAMDGTYNISQAFKIINKDSDIKYKFPDFPKEGQFKKTRKISDNEKEILKDYKITGNEQQIWKRRLSYFGSSKSNYYLNYGLNFESSDLFSNLINNNVGKNNCINCGNFFSKGMESKQSLNPLLNEHHNNEIDGFSNNLRKKVKLCPICYLGATVSLFDKYLPFYNTSNTTTIFLPNVFDFKLLFKIINNLSLPGQFIDFNLPSTIKYSTNVKFLENNNCISLALLTVLHNIQNNYSKDEVNDLFQVLNNDELMQIVDWIYIIKDSFKIHRIKADSNIYKILKPQKDKNNNEVFLVTDVFNKILIKNIVENELEDFYNSFLVLNQEKIAKNLFRLSKIKISDIIVSDKGYSLYLFKEIFLNIIMDVINMIEEDLKVACKNIAKEMGKSFYNDVGMLTKFAYATDEGIFKNVIEEASFLMAKKSALSNKNFYLYSNDLEILLDNLNGDNFNEIKNYFVSFMSANAIYNNYNQNNKNKTEDE